ncbi:MAG TPA: hypothetical protein VMH28_01060 [Candidatus Acidoferrales bacterium]|nr:hypothetical protein [Candidatus Acidoferrales bacterium]
MFQPGKYGEEVARILALDAAGERLIPLTTAECSSVEARRLIRAAKVSPEVRAGLFFYFSCWTEAHETAQNIDSVEGSYWHAMVHRQEPDAWNSGYWFRRVGQHPVFPALRQAAAALGLNFGTDWDPVAFIDYCVGARPGSEEERKALEVQRAEWQLLFAYCARQGVKAGTGGL